MHIVPFLLPLRDNAGGASGAEEYGFVRDELTHRFGGLTAYSRAPAEGVWDVAGGRAHDEVVV